VTTHPDDADRIADVVTGAVEQVFDTVAAIHGAALAVLGVGSEPSDAAPAGLEERARALLGAPGQLAVGLGLVAAPRPEGEVGLLWWQVDPAGGRLVALHPDLRPASLGYYDYTATDWFDVPRRTGRRHVVGPYVDVHGTGRYLLTLTAPVVAAGEFLGVVGADVPVSRFEGQLLRALGPIDRPLVLLDEEGRVVLSTSPRWLVGDLTRTPPAGAGPAAGIPGVPWRLYLPAPADGLQPV
jgi:hypothetical protein